MNITTQGKFDETIVLEETFRAPRDKVFKAWTKPEALKNWFMADDSVTVTDAQVELREGGPYYIEVKFPGYDPSRIEGEFLLVKTNDKLAYTWLTPPLQGRKTKVEVRFEALDKGSKIYLTHGEFKTEEELQLHLDGWKGCIGKLQEYLAGK